MGKGNICTHYECEGLYYLDYELLHKYQKVTRCTCGLVTGFDRDAEPLTARELSKAGIAYDFTGAEADWAYNSKLSGAEWRYMISYVTTVFRNRVKSFKTANKRRNEFNIVLQSELFQLAVADNEWGAAWCLLEREDVVDIGTNRTFMRKHYKTYLEAIKFALLEGWGEAVAYGSAWQRGNVYKKAI